MPQFCTQDATTKKFIQPDYARFKLLYCGHEGGSSKGYSCYFSIDWQPDHGGYHDELKGLQDLLKRMIYDKPPNWTVWAKLYINLTLDLSIKSKNYNHEIAYFVGHENKMPEVKLAWKTDPSRTIIVRKINITETLRALRPIEEWNRKRKYYLGL